MIKRNVFTFKALYLLLTLSNNGSPEGVKEIEAKMSEAKLSM